MSRQRVRPLSLDRYPLLAGAIGDTPVSTIALHLLVRGLGRAYVAGDPARFRAAVIQSVVDPTEPAGFGTDAPATWRLLQAMRGWHCVCVDRECAPALGALVERETGAGVRYYGDVQYALLGPVATYRAPEVRRLTLDDLALLRAAPPAVRGGGWADTGQMLAEGVVAGALVAGALVAIAYTSARTPRHADIGVTALEPWRGRGFATAAASLVAAQLQAAGLTPVWSTGEDNRASLRVAQKLGFTEVARRTYVIPETAGRG